MKRAKPKNEEFPFLSSFGMLDIEYRLLSYVKDNRRKRWEDILNAFDPQSACRSVNAILHCLLRENLIKAFGTPPDCSVQITPEGVRKLAQYQQEQQRAQQLAKQRTKERKEDMRANLTCAVVGAAIGFLASILTAVIPRFLP